MPTPDPIALPELPEPSLIQDEREFVYAYDADDMRAYGQACVDAAHPIPADMVLVPRGELNRVIHELRTYAPAADTYKGAHIHGVWAKELEQLSATPPLNELLGHPEQLASLEQRAREILGEEYRRTHDANPRVNLDEATYGLALRAVTAALSAQFTDNGADAECACTGQVVRDGVTYCSDCGRTLSAQLREVEWRCFYCDAVFTDTESAALHFGTGGMARHDEPACRIDIAKYREMESLLSRYQDVAAATTPQDAAGVEQPVAIEQLSTNAPLRHSERADAEQAYTLTAFDYVHAPVGTHDWQLYWRGWWHRSQLYTTPPPGVDVGKLRELVASWRNRAGKAEEDSLRADSIGFHDASATAGKRARVIAKLADELAAIIGNGGVAASETVTVPRELTLDMLEAAEQEIAMGNDFADAWEAAIATHLMEPTRSRCEGGSPECGPVEFHDSEGVPLCRTCWEGLIADSSDAAAPMSSAPCPTCNGLAHWPRDADDGDDVTCGTCKGTGKAAAQGVGNG